MTFIDTSFFVAAAIPSDGRHRVARHMVSLAPVAAFTSELVLGETWALVCSRVGHGPALVAIERIRESVSILGVDDDVTGEAWGWLRRHDERPYSFVDATSFALMRRHRVTRALTFDGDFAAAGFTVVGAD